MTLEKYHAFSANNIFSRGHSGTHENHEVMLENSFDPSGFKSGCFLLPLSEDTLPKKKAKRTAVLTEDRIVTYGLVYKYVQT